MCLVTQSFRIYQNIIISKVKKMNGMIGGCYKLKEVKVSFNFPEKVLPRCFAKVDNLEPLILYCLPVTADSDISINHFFVD